MFRESWYYYNILGMSCLHTGDYAGAYSYLRRAADLDPNRSETMLGIGAVLLRRRQIDLAIRNYLDLLDQNPQERRARKALQWIRRLDDPDDVIDWFESDRIRHILPRRGLFVPRFLTVGAGLGVIVAAAVFLGPGIVDTVRDFMPRNERVGSSVLELEDTTELIEDTEATPARVQLADNEVERLFRRIGDYFNDGRDNLVRRELNRLDQSNASPAVKRQAGLIREYLVEPDFATMRDNFTYDEVTADTTLYHDVYVRWRGRIANLVIGEEAITFDLLVGYESGRVLDGIVPVRVPYAVLLDENQSVELIGRVTADPAGEAGFFLVISSIRRLSPDERESQ
jgi:tetratricopeptide (TPR) repeat protein